MGAESCDMAATGVCVASVAKDAAAEVDEPSARKMDGRIASKIKTNAATPRLPTRVRFVCGDILSLTPGTRNSCEQFKHRTLRPANKRGILYRRSQAGQPITIVILLSLPLKGSSRADHGPEQGRIADNSSVTRSADRVREN